GRQVYERRKAERQAFWVTRRLAETGSHAHTGSAAPPKTRIFPQPARTLPLLRCTHSRLAQVHALHAVHEKRQMICSQHILYARRQQVGLVRAVLQKSRHTSFCLTSFAKTSQFSRTHFSPCP